MQKISVVFFGTPAFSAYILEQLLPYPGSGTDIKFHIKAVVTSPDKPVGRKQIITPSAVSKVAATHGIPVLQPVKLDPAFITTHYRLFTTDLFIVASYGKIIPQSLLDIPKHGSINVHPSLLPKYRGASPIQAAILNGDKKTGVTIMLMDAGMDHGPILTAEKVGVSEDETYESLSTKMSNTGVKLLIKTVPRFIKGEIKPRLQNHAIATFCNRIKKEDGYFDIKTPPAPEILDRMIRAYYPWPNAWTTWQGKIVKFLPNQMIQMEGKKPVFLKDFLNGYPDFPIKQI